METLTNAVILGTKIKHIKALLLKIQNILEGPDFSYFEEQSLHNYVDVIKRFIKRPVALFL